MDKVLLTCLIEAQLVVVSLYKCIVQKGLLQIMYSDGRLCCCYGECALPVALEDKKYEVAPCVMLGGRYV
eukprot:jgi/Antlo1/1414/1381